MRALEDIIKNLAKRGYELKEESLFGFCFVNLHGRLGRTSIVLSFNDGWEHVSICGSNGLPTWPMMCELKDACWKEDEEVYQIHPKKEEYVNIMENCLHLWKPIEKYVGKMTSPNE